MRMMRKQKLSLCDCASAQGFAKRTLYSCDFYFDVLRYRYQKKGYVYAFESDYPDKY